MLSHAKVQVLDKEMRSLPWKFVFAEPQGTVMIMTEMTSHGDAPQLLSTLHGTLSGLAAGTYVLRVTRGNETKDFTIEIPLEGATERELRM